MKRFLCALLLVYPLLAQKPKLVVTIVVDQFRYDYLTRFASEYKGGLSTLLSKGAVFTNARYDQFPTVTAVGAQHYHVRSQPGTERNCSATHGIRGTSIGS